MKACPTGAIRVKNGLAIINDNKCIDCGDCAVVCPQQAIIVEQDDFSIISQYKTKVLLVPGVFFGQFPEKIKTGHIYAALKKLGFTQVFEVENTIGFILHDYEEEREDRSDSFKISSFCPAVIRLIQVRFPSMVDHIAKIKPPIDLAAQYMRDKLESEGAEKDETGIFYVTPCAAKIASVKSPVDRESTGVDGVINMQFLYNLVNQEIHNSRLEEETDLNQQMLSASGVLWSLTGGETRNMKGKTLSIDGIHNVNSFLEKMENDAFEPLDFLELRSCDQSCAGGLLITGDRFLTASRIKKRSASYPSQESKNLYRKLGPEDKYLGKINPRPIDPLDKDMSRSIEKMNYKQELMETLPGRDCGACGAPDCQSLAEDIARGTAELSHCVFIQQDLLKLGKLSIEECKKDSEIIWGKNKNNKV